MASEMANVKSEAPFITMFAESRRSSTPFPGRYSEELKISVVMKSGRETPLISAYDNPEIYTKTEAVRESDDDEKFSILLESVIKTNVQRETDTPDGSHPAELMTKTFADRESDDDDKYLALELYTKTKIEREGDDHHYDVQ